MELSKVEVSDTDSIADGFFDEIASEHSAKPEKLTDTLSSFRPTESDTTDNAGQVYQRLSLAEAAVHFGVSERTIQRRIAKEALRSEKDDQGKVFVFFVRHCLTPSTSVTTLVRQNKLNFLKSLAGLKPVTQSRTPSDRSTRVLSDILWTNWKPPPTETAIWRRNSLKRKPKLSY